jgi:hypothetical protein
MPSRDVRVSQTSASLAGITRDACAVAVIHAPPALALPDDTTRETRFGRFEALLGGEPLGAAILGLRPPMEPKRLWRVFDTSGIAGPCLPRP